MGDPARSVAPSSAPDHARPEQCVSAMGYTVFNDDLATIPLSYPCSTIQTISPISYGNAVNDPLYRAAMQEADWLCLDGVYFALAAIVLHGKTIKPNAGPAIFRHFMGRLDQTGGKAFFLGASNATLAKMKARAAVEFTNVAVDIFSPPFKPEFSDADNDAMIAAINAFRPDVVFLGMTAPKQEKWGYLHRDRLDAKLVASIGGVFDWFAGNRPEIAPIWWKLHLAWLVRTIDRPELLKRYPLIGRFFWHLALTRMGLRKYSA
jgi:N-acetylglucosaminyldiphosphoundecaprenol N-acetyl-beta-D-mannosaminyltransferase